MGKCKKSSAQSGAFNLENVVLNVKQPFTTITNDFIRKSNLSDGAFKTFINLLSYSRDFNISIRNLTKLLNKSKKTIENHLKELQQKGFLKIIYDKELKNHIYELNETPNKKESKQNPTSQEIEQRKNAIKWAIKYANEINADIKDKQAFNSIMTEMLKTLDKNKAE